MAVVIMLSFIYATHGIWRGAGGQLAEKLSIVSMETEYIGSYK